MATDLAYCQTEDIAEIASAIRSKSGKVVKMKLGDMPAEIDALDDVGILPGEIIAEFDGINNKPNSDNGTSTSYGLMNLSRISPIVTTSGLISRVSGMVYRCPGPWALLGYIGSWNGNDNVSFALNADKVTFKDLTINFNCFCDFTYGGVGYGNVTTGDPAAGRLLVFENCKVEGTSMKNFLYGNPYTVSLDLSGIDSSNITDMTNFLCVRSDVGNLVSLKLSDNWASNAAITSFDFSKNTLNHDVCLELFNKLAPKTSATLTLNSSTKSAMLASEIKIITDKGWTVA